jgi:hypothetical protein
MYGVGEESDEEAEMSRPNRSRFPTTKTASQKFKWKLQMRIIRQLRYLEIIRNHGLVLLADYEQSIVADNNVAGLHWHDHTVNPPTAVSLPNMQHTSSCPAAT